MAPEANLEEVTGTRHKANEGKGILGEEQHENYPVMPLIWQERPGEGPGRGQASLGVKGMRGWVSATLLVVSPEWKSDMAVFILSEEWHGQDSIPG